MSEQSNSQTQDEFSKTSSSYKTTLTAIRKARRFALQGLYEWQVSQNPIHNIESHTRAQNAMHTVHLGYYHELMHEIVKQIEELDALITSKIDRNFSELDGVELAALRIGTYELKHRLEIPFKVVIDEAIQLNSHFGSVEGYKFINAILDKLAQELREPEVQAQQSSKEEAKQESKNESDK